LESSKFTSTRPTPSRYEGRSVYRLLQGVRDLCNRAAGTALCPQALL
jgi:hypothetical protein